MENPFSRMLNLLKENGLEHQILDFSGTKLPKITDEIKNKISESEEAPFLILNNCGLESLDNFPVLDVVDTVDLRENKIKGSELAKLVEKAARLQTLLLDGNDIKEYSELEPLTKLKELRELNLMNTPLSKKKDYRERIFKMFSSVEVLDFLDQDGQPVEFLEVESEGDLFEDVSGDSDGEEYEEDEDVEDAEGEEYDEEEDESDEEIEAKAHSKKKQKK